MDLKILSQKFFEYSIYMRGYSKATVGRYKYVIQFYIRHTGIERLDQVSEANIRDLFLYGRMQRHWSTNTYLVFYKSLLVFFRWCLNQGYIKENPVEKVEVPRLEKRFPPKLSKQDTLRLLEIVNNYPYDYTYLRYRNHAIFSMFIFAGLRKNELLNLKFSDVDINNLTIYVKQGKGNKDRIIPMSFTLAQTLKKYLEHRKRLSKTCPEFFTSLWGSQPFTDSGLKKVVDQVRDCSGIKFTVHKLRHTFATLMLEGGCDIFSLSRMMGHSDIKTTTIYLNASAEHLRAQITKHPLNEL